MMRRRKFIQSAAGVATSVFLYPYIKLNFAKNISVNNFTKNNELWQMSATQLNSLVRQKKVSVKEIIEAHIKRIKAVNPKVNAITSLLEKSAVNEAEKKDQSLSKNPEVGNLFGIPFSIKENIDLTGSATTEGVQLLKDNIVLNDSPHVALMKKNGAIPLARTNMPDFGLRYHTDNDLYGATINPWNSSLTPGGSSGGDAVAVATGMVPIGLGNDYGGSIRYPAQCCGICGLRPSRGMIPFYTHSLSHGIISNSLKMFAVQGPLARTIADLRVALTIMSSSDPRDSNWVPVSLDSKLNKPFRIALITNPGNYGVENSVKAAVLKAASILEKNGGMIEEIDSLPLRESSQLWLNIISADIQNLFMSSITENASRNTNKFVEEFLLLQTNSELPDYINNLARINGITNSWNDFFQKYDAVVGPVSSRNPFKVGSDISGSSATRLLLDSQCLNVSVNLLGLPSVALPVGIDNGVPQSVQIIGPLYKEFRCLDLAQIIENEVGIFTPIDPIN